MKDNIPDSLQLHIRAQTHILINIHLLLFRYYRQPIIHLLFEVVFIGQITLRFLSINIPYLLILRQFALTLEQ